MTVYKSAEEISLAVKKLGALLTSRLGQIMPAGVDKNAAVPPCFVCVGHDSFIFYADLIRAIDQDIRCEVVLNNHINAAFLKNVKSNPMILVTTDPINTQQLKLDITAAGASSVWTVSLFSGDNNFFSPWFSAFTAQTPASVKGYGLGDNFGSDILK